MGAASSLATERPQHHHENATLSVSLWNRLGALSGVGAVGLIAAHSILTDPYDPATDPNPTQPAAMLARALVENREEARLGAYLGLADVFLLLWLGLLSLVLCLWPWRAPRPAETA